MTTAKKNTSSKKSVKAKMVTSKKNMKMDAPKSRSVKKVLPMKKSANKTETVTINGKDVTWGKGTRFVIEQTKTPTEKSGYKEVFKNTGDLDKAVGVYFDLVNKNFKTKHKFRMTMLSTGKASVILYRS